MGLFGKRRGVPLPGTLAPYDPNTFPAQNLPSAAQTPGIGDGLPQGGVPQAEEAPQSGSRGLFGAKFNEQGGWGDRLAMLGSVLRDNSDGTELVGLLAQRQETQAAALRAQQEREAGMQDWLAKQQWERANPAPMSPHYWETNDGSLAVVGPDGKPQVVYKDPSPKMNFIPDGLGGGQWVAVPGAATQEAPPQAPVGQLRPIGGMSLDQAAPVLGGAAQANTITAQEAQTVRQSLGPNGQAAFEKWMRDNNITIGGQ